jgi:RNA polymerase sigma factor (sigma-70 family)
LVKPQKPVSAIFPLKNLSEFPCGVRLIDVMQSPSDAALLAEYAVGRSEAAFAQLVQRYVALVYSAALRQVGNPHSAEEVTQAVFIILARKAGGLGPKTVLAGWLCRTAHLAARDFLKSERRRQQREHNAYLQCDMNSSATDTQITWQQLAPVLDEAVAQLGDEDRAAVVLRYFEQRPLDEVGAALGMGADAAQKRVTRALDKLRKRFAKRGLTLSVALIAGAVSVNSMSAAPVGLATKISVVSGKGIVTASITAMVKGTLKTMIWNNLKLPAMTAAAIILAAGTLTLLAQRAEKPVARIPYKILEDGWLFQQSINPTNLVFHFLISSNNRKVNPQTIHLMIHSASQGDIPLQLGEKGQLLAFPCDDDLRRENPSVVTDQPKGTLGSGWWIYVPRPEGVTFQYDLLSNAVDEANKAAARANHLAESDYGQSVPMFPGTVNGVVLVFPHASAGKAKITIATAGGVKEYVADSHGLIPLKINPRLQAENPTLTVSERPDWIAITRF